MTRRGATGLRGVLPIDKPAGLTSHDVVARLRKATGEGRIGHAGTLDPAATGLLVVLLGPYTRLEPYLSAERKSYVARISFGRETDTDDAEGVTIRNAPVPDPVRDPGYARAALAGLLGPSLQQPPAFSAIKVAGQVAHRAARAGAPIDLEPRPIDVLEAELLDIDGPTGDWTALFTVSKGTYVRALARDLGRACGTAAHLAGLRRTASGSLSLRDAVPLDAALSTIASGGLASLLVDPLVALGLPVVAADQGATRTGSPLPLPPDQRLTPAAPVAITEGGVFRAVYRVEADRLVPAAVMPEEVAA